MNSARFQGKINIQISVAFCAVIMSFQKEKQENNLVENCIKNKKIPQNKLNQGGERSTHKRLKKKKKNADEGN